MDNFEGASRILITTKYYIAQVEDECIFVTANIYYVSLLKYYTDYSSYVMMDQIIHTYEPCTSQEGYSISLVLLCLTSILVATSRKGNACLRRKRVFGLAVYGFFSLDVTTKVLVRPRLSSNNCSTKVIRFWPLDVSYVFYKQRFTFCPTKVKTQYVQYKLFYFTKKIPKSTTSTDDISAKY